MLDNHFSLPNKFFPGQLKKNLTYTLAINLSMGAKRMFVFFGFLKNTNFD
jgi:hypothetical protein